MRRFVILTLIALSAAFEFHSQTPPQTSPGKPAFDPNKLAIEFVDRLNGLDDWYLSVDGKEEVDQVVDRMMALVAPDVLAEVPPHDEKQYGPVMLVGREQFRKWVEKIAKSRIKINYVMKRQTQKEFEGELMVLDKQLPWGGLAISLQVIAGYGNRDDRRVYMEPGAIFIQYREDGKIERIRLFQTEKDEIVISGER